MSIAKAINYRGNIVIDYVSYRDHLRFHIGISKIPKDESIFKNGQFTAKKENYINLNIQINNQLNEVNEIINNYLFSNKSKPPVSFIRREISKRQTQVNLKFNSVIEYFNEFIEYKKTKPIQDASIKDYTSTFNALKLYEHIKKTKLLIDDINTKKFIEKFELFLSQDHSKYKEFKTKGNQSDNTNRKRTSIIKEFLNYLEDEEIIKVNSKVKHFKSALKKYIPTIVTLNKEELNQLYNLKVETEDEQKVKDFFIFLTMTGMRYSDFVTLKKSMVKEDVIIKKTKKNQIQFEVPLNKHSKAIIEKYNYNFKKYSTTYFNKLLKELLYKYKLFNYDIQVEEKKYNIIKEITIKKYLAISSHSGRKIFISRSVEENINLKEIMHYTGHKKFDTLLHYLDVFGNKNFDQIKKLELF